MARTQSGQWPLKLICAALAAGFAQAAVAMPNAPAVVNGSASFSQTGNALTVTNTDRAIINWNTFSIGSNESVRFVQPSASSTVMNRVLAADPSVLLGALQSNGKVFLFNPAGITVGAGARIDVAGFVASTMTLSNEDFLANRLNFVATPGAGSVKVENGAEITTASGGQVYLIAPQVENSGLITTPQGEIILAAGQRVELIDTGTPGVKVAVVAGNEQVLNMGQLMAESGRVGMVGAVVKQQGTVSADSIVREGGRIFLKAMQSVELAAGSTTSADGTQGGRVEVDGGGTTLVSGKISATGSSGTGGGIELLGDKVGVLAGAVVDASGETGGGSVLVGGDYQGKNADVRNATVTYVAPDAIVRADATASGNGGRIIVWADDTTRAYGRFSARGGAGGGDGGLVETSGHRFLDAVGARADTTAARGKTGLWLLDPGQVDIISGSALTNISAGPNFTPSTGVSTLGTTEINTMLATNNVAITTVGGSGGNGNITLAAGATINYNAGVARTLSFTAENDIVLQGTIQNTSTGGGLFSVDLNAGNQILTPVGQSFTLAGGAGTAPIMMQINGGKTWNNYGAVTLNGQSQIHLHDGSLAAAFHNKAGATFTTNSVHPGGFSFYSSPANDGDVTNWGNFTFGAGSTARSVEARFNQYAGGVLTLPSGSPVSLQNAGQMDGTIAFTGGTLWLSEYHGTDAIFDGTTMTGTGTLSVKGSVGSPTAHFRNVTASGVTLSVGDASNSGMATVYDGNSEFAGLSVDPVNGSFTLSNAILGINGTLTIPTGATHVGDVGYFATGDVFGTSIAAPSSSLKLIANWNGDFAAPNTTAGTGDIIVTGVIDAMSLDAKAAAGIALNGGNLIDNVNLKSLSGDVSYHTANPNTTRIGAESTGGGNITVIGDAGSTSIQLVELRTSGGGNVAVSAQGQILEGDWYGNSDVGVADIIVGTGAVTLTSQVGTPISGTLAISADIDSNGGSVGASVTGGPYGSIGIRDVGANQAATVTLDASAASAEGDVGYFRDGDLNINAGMLTLTPMPANIPLGIPAGATRIGAAGDIQLSTALTMAGANAELHAGGDLTIAAGGALTMNGDGFIGAGGNLNLTGGNILMQGATNGVFAGGTLTVGTAKTLTASTGDLYVGAGSILLNGTVSGYGDTFVQTPGSLTINGGGLYSTFGNLYFAVDGPMSVIGSVMAAGGIVGDALGGLTLGAAAGGTGYMQASNGVVDLFVGGTGIEMYNGSYINSTDATQPAGGLITIFFPGLSAGGSLIDGVATFDGGYKVGGALTTLGSGLEVTYGILTNPVSDAIVSAMNSTSSSGGGTSETSDSLVLVDTSSGTSTTTSVDVTQTVGATEGTFGGTEATTTENSSTTGSTQEAQNAKKTPAQCSA